MAVKTAAKEKGQVEHSESPDSRPLVNEKYVLMLPDADGLIESHTFPGLRLAVKALMGENLARVLSELQKGLETAEHTAFVRRLIEKSN